MTSLFDHMKEKGITEIELARICGVTRPTIKNWNKTNKIQNKEIRNTLKELFPGYNPTTKSRKKKTQLKLYDTDLRKPIYDKERNSDFPKIKIIKKK